MRTTAMRWRVAELPITLENRSDHLEGPVNFVALNDERRRAPDYALVGFFAEDAKFFQGFHNKDGQQCATRCQSRGPRPRTSFTADPLRVLRFCRK